MILDSKYKKQRAFLAPDVIMHMLIGDKKSLMILRNEYIELITSDFALYEAISSLEKSEISFSILTEFLYRVQIISSPKLEINMKRIKHLRGIIKLK